MKQVLFFGSKLSFNFGGPSIFFGTLKFFEPEKFLIHFNSQSYEDDPATLEFYLKKSNITYVRMPRQKIIYIGFITLVLNSVMPEFLRIRTIKRIIQNNAFCRILNKYDIVCDIRGISQTDFFGKGFRSYLGENVMLLTAKMLGKKALKLTQDMGPFMKMSNRLSVKWIYPRYDLIVARGIVTKELLNEIGIRKNVITKPDTGFLLECSEAGQAEKLLQNYDLAAGKYIVVAASRQIDRRSKPGRQVGLTEYVYNMIRLIDRIQEDHKYKIVLLPNERHKSRKGTDDLTISLQIQDNIKDKKDLMVIEENLNAFLIKSLIANSYLVISSRYHSVVAALSSCIPVFVISWGYKYDQILSISGISDLIRNHKEFSCENTYFMINNVIKNHDHYQEILRLNIPEVIRQIEDLKIKIQEVI